MNSFISWIGGKKLLRKQIIHEFPQYYKRYVEVFGGAGWVLFGLENKGQIEIYNDKDNNIVILDVLDDSPAEKAGIKRDYIVKKIDEA